MLARSPIELALAMINPGHITKPRMNPRGTAQSQSLHFLPPFICPDIQAFPFSADGFTYNSHHKPSFATTAGAMGVSYNFNLRRFTNRVALHVKSKKGRGAARQPLSPFSRNQKIPLKYLSLGWLVPVLHTGVVCSEHCCCKWLLKCLLKYHRNCSLEYRIL
jgi:hypothetical protein